MFLLVHFLFPIRQFLRFSALKFSIVVLQAMTT